MYPETGAVLDGNENVSAVWASVVYRLCMDFTADEGGAADLALVLALSAVVVIEILMGSAAHRTDLVIGDRITFTPSDRLEILAISVPVVFDEELPVLPEEGDDRRKFIRFEFLVLG